MDITELEKSSLEDIIFNVDFSNNLNDNDDDNDDDRSDGDGNDSAGNGGGDSNDSHGRGDGRSGGSGGGDNAGKTVIFPKNIIRMEKCIAFCDNVMDLLYMVNGLTCSRPSPYENVP